MPRAKFAEAGKTGRMTAPWIGHAEHDTLDAVPRELQAAIARAIGGEPTSSEPAQLAIRGRETAIVRNGKGSFYASTEIAPEPYDPQQPDTDLARTMALYQQAPNDLPIPNIVEVGEVPLADDSYGRFTIVECPPGYAPGANGPLSPDELTRIIELADRTRWGLAAVSPNFAVPRSEDTLADMFTGWQKIQHIHADRGLPRNPLWAALEPYLERLPALIEAEYGAISVMRGGSLIQSDLSPAHMWFGGAADGSEDVLLHVEGLRQGSPNILSTYMWLAPALNDRLFDELETGRFAPYPVDPNPEEAQMYFAGQAGFCFHRLLDPTGIDAGLPPDNSGRRDAYFLARGRVALYGSLLLDLNQPGRSARPPWERFISTGLTTRTHPDIQPGKNGEPPLPPAGVGR